MEMNKKLSVFLCLLLVAALSMTTVPAYASGSGTGLDDTPGNSVVTALKSFASGGWGKALFFCSLLTGVICIIFTRHRGFGLIALVFGILLGVYGGLGESLWQLFTSWGSGG
jgi:hypothetical protein